MFLSSVFLFRILDSWIVYSWHGFIFFSDLCLLAAMWVILLPRLRRLSSSVVPPSPV
jgi:hypothetical protein